MPPAPDPTLILPPPPPPPPLPVVTREDTPPLARRGVGTIGLRVGVFVIVPVLIV
jgi:hypothetical protein